MAFKEFKAYFAVLLKWICFLLLKESLHECLIMLLNEIFKVSFSVRFPRSQL